MEHWPLGPQGAVLVRTDEDGLPAVLDVLEDAAGWLASIGHEAWPVGSFAAAGTRERRQVVDALETGELYLVTIAGDPAATMSLFEQDERFWPGAPRNALYVHKLAVRRRFAGIGVGEAMLAWAERRARERRKPYLRLDTDPDNPGILAYYERHGFRRVGDAVDGDLHVALLERMLDPEGSGVSARPSA
jgi:ribosomal protein S18 acetylase RimI-like enzyme